MKTRIGVDVDGVLRDFSTGVYDVINKYYPDYIKDGINSRQEMTDWDLENSFNASREEIHRIY